MSATVWQFEDSLALPFFGIAMKMELFRSCGHCWVFQICWHIECSTFIASPFRIRNSSARILPSPPPALSIVMLTKAHLTSHSRMSDSRWVTMPSRASSSLRLFKIQDGSVLAPGKTHRGNIAHWPTMGLLGTETWGLLWKPSTKWWSLCYSSQCSHPSPTCGLSGAAAHSPVGPASHNGWHQCPKGQPHRQSRTSKSSGQGTAPVPWGLFPASSLSPQRYAGCFHSMVRRAQPASVSVLTPAKWDNSL